MQQPRRRTKGYVKGKESIITSLAVLVISAIRTRHCNLFVTYNRDKDTCLGDQKLLTDLEIGVGAGCHLPLLSTSEGGDA